MSETQAQWGEGIRRIGEREEPRAIDGEEAKTLDATMFTPALERANRLADRQRLQAEVLAPARKAIEADHAAAHAADRLTDLVGSDFGALRPGGGQLPPGGGARWGIELNPGEWTYPPPYDFARNGPTQGAGSVGDARAADGNIELDLNGGPSSSGVLFSSAAVGLEFLPKRENFVTVAPTLDYQFAWSISTLLSESSCGFSLGVFVEREGGTGVGSRADHAVVEDARIPTSGSEEGRWTASPPARFLAARKDNYRAWIWANLWGSEVGSTVEAVLVVKLRYVTVKVA